MTDKEDQIITYDDFEKSLQKEGIEIVIPEQDEENPPEGIGAVGYSPRYTAPSATNPYYLKYGKGGYNRCLLISGNSCLPNCVGYAHGRTLEIGGKTSNAKLPTCNAEDWYATAKANGLVVGSTPKLGAVIVWKSGNLWNGNDGCGHVGVVEDIASDGTITVSQSNYGGTRFFLTKHKSPYNIYGQTFVGFIYNPYVQKAEWRKDGTGWWYRHADGSYTTNGWEKINGKWYYFDSRGYMKTGWIDYKNGRYYCSENGDMVTGWQLIRERWYYFNENGLMLTGWIKYKNNWYCLAENGEMFVGEHPVLAYFNESGALERKK